MDGPQDLGGRAGFGPINAEADEPVFHAEWEKRALGVTLACGALGYWSIDEGRFFRENVHPGFYYNATYYEIWITALEAMLVNHGELGAQELAAGRMRKPGIRAERCLPASKVAATLAAGGPSLRDVDSAAKFAVGDAVRSIKAHPHGHTRLPAYARDKAGVVEAVRGAHVFPDSNAQRQGEQPQWLYTVTFSGQELWGADSEPDLNVSIDAWESYLVRA